MRIHDLLEIDVTRFPRAAPEWVLESLRRAPLVVVRRGVITDDNIPVGIRGALRRDRWAAFCPPHLIKRILTPEALLDRVLPDRGMPALRALRVLKERWRCNWGPGGSVGFELATGAAVVTPSSDLDAVIYASEPIDTCEARSLLEATRGLPAAVDVRVETPRVGFSLAEYVQGTKLLLRTPGGPVLGTDPWSL